MSEMQMIFLVQKEGLLRIWDELMRCLSEESCAVSLYYYAEDKKEVLKREALERLPELHFEIIADVHAIVLQGDSKSVGVRICASEELKNEALRWFRESGVPEKTIQVIS